MKACSRLHRALAGSCRPYQDHASLPLSHPLHAPVGEVQLKVPLRCVLERVKLGQPRAGVRFAEDILAVAVDSWAVPGGRQLLGQPKELRQLFVLRGAMGRGRRAGAEASCNKLPAAFAR